MECFKWCNSPHNSRTVCVVVAQLCMYRVRMNKYNQRCRADIHACAESIIPGLLYLLYHKASGLLSPSDFLSWHSQRV